MLKSLLAINKKECTYSTMHACMHATLLQLCLTLRPYGL